MQGLGSKTLHSRFDLHDIITAMKVRAEHVRTYMWSHTTCCAQDLGLLPSGFEVPPASEEFKDLVPKIVAGADKRKHVRTQYWTQCA